MENLNFKNESLEEAKYYKGYDLDYVIMKRSYCFPCIKTIFINCLNRDPNQVDLSKYLH